MNTRKKRLKAKVSSIALVDNINAIDENEGLFIPKDQRPWFYKKNGEIGYVDSYPIDCNGKVIREKTETLYDQIQSIKINREDSSKRSIPLKKTVNLQRA